MNYEIEIKSLLGSAKNAQKLKEKIIGKADLATKNKQLNHYFIGGDLKKLEDKIAPYISKEKFSLFKRIIEEGKNHSIRTRKMDEKVLFIIKASIDDTTSANGISRLEFEEIFGKSIEELDQILLDSGLKYQAKWSREREEYKLDDISICIDKNAGYGYLAEFEKVISDPMEAESAKNKLRALMRELEVEELAQDRLERMFSHYNANWSDYYGTDKIFVVK